MITESEEKASNSPLPVEEIQPSTPSPKKDFHKENSCSALEAWNLFLESGQVAELRIIKAFKNYISPLSGYYNNFEKMIKDAMSFSGKAEAVYITLNPVDPSLLARSNNRLIENAKTTTTDENIIKYRWLFVDLDVKGAKNISSTDEGHDQAFQRARQVKEYLQGLGWPDPIICDSGNGCHLQYRINLPNDIDSIALVKSVLETLSRLFSDKTIIIDVETANPGRLTKFYGTKVCKGEDFKGSNEIPARPHRTSKFIIIPAEIGIVPHELLELLVADNFTQKSIHAVPKTQTSGVGNFDIDQYFIDHKIPVSSPKTWGNGGRKWEIQVCPGDPNHNRGECCITQLPGGAISAKCQHVNCRIRTWYDLKDIFDPGWRDRKRKIIPGYHTTKTEIVWPDIQPIPEKYVPVPSLPSDLIPAPLREWVLDNAERICIPLEYVAAPVIVELGSIIGRTVGILPKKQDDWLCVPNLWGALIGGPAVLKSPAIQAAMKPVDYLARKAATAFKDAKIQSESDKSCLELEIEAVKKAIGCNLKKGSEFKALKQKLRELTEQSQDSKVTEKRYVTQDSTIEKLGMLLNENPRGLLIMRDELAGWLKTLDRPGREGDREFFLESWNGTGRFSVDRVGRGTLHINALTLAVFGTIQPGKFSTYINGALEQGELADGLLPRFQIVIWPDDLGEWRNVDRWPNKDARMTAFEIFEKLDALKPKDDPIKAVQEEGDEIPAIRFTEEAQALFNEWRDDLERALRVKEMEKCPAYASHLGKYRSLMPKLALIFHLVAVVSGTFDCFGGCGVSLNATKLAVKWVNAFLLPHATKIYNAEIERERNVAHLLASKIESGAVVDGMTIRDINRRGWSGLTADESVDLAIKELEKIYWVRIETLETGGRPSEVLRIHPSLRKVEKS